MLVILVLLTPNCFPLSLFLGEGFVIVYTLNILNLLKIWDKDNGGEKIEISLDWNIFFDSGEYFLLFSF